jgi:VWFA-related protein
MRARLTGLAALLASTVAAAGQQSTPAPSRDLPPVTFRAETSYVEVDAVATDAQGRLVVDLDRADFEVLEDGRPQRIDAFSLVQLPDDGPVARSTAVALQPPSDVVANTAATGRIYLLVLDDLHTTVANTPRVKAFLREFLERGFADIDLAAVAYTSGRTTASQDFTNDRRLLLDAVDKFTGRRLRSEALEIAEALNRDPRDPSDTPVNPRARAGDGRDPFDPYSRLNPFEAERASQARTTLTVVKDLAALLEGVRGRRKSMLLVSEGLSYNVYDGFRNTSAGVVLGGAADAMAAAMRANVAIYAVDPRGLATFGDAIDVPGTSPNDPHFSVPGTMLDLLRLSQQSLRTLAEQTGGFAGLDQNDLSGVLDRVVRENSAYYLLGYSSTNTRRDGRFRRIEVRARRPGVQVRARRGYLAPRNSPSDQAAAVRPLDRALGSPIPVTSIPLTVSAAAYADQEPGSRSTSVAIAIEMRTDAFRFTQKADRWLDTVDVVVTAADAEGLARDGRQHTLDLEMREATATLARARGLRVISEIGLPPGRHRLRIGVAESGAGRVGTIWYDLDVPDFRAPGLQLSGIALTSAATAETPTVRALDPLKEVLLAPPTTVREFGRDDVIALYAELYDNTPSASPRVVELSTVARADDGRVVFERREERPSGGLNGRHRYALQIPLSAFAPGAYTLRVEGRTPGGGGAATARELRVQIR